jgi:hypothetical protein
MLAALDCEAFTWHNGPIYSNMKFDLTDGSSRAKTLACTAICFVGNTLTVIGCIGLLLGTAGAFDMDIFALGLSSGVRIIGSVAIAGCLLSAIGYGLSDYAVNK